MTVLTVSQLNHYTKCILDENKKLKNIFVVGEVSNFRYYQQSGHMYFSLKDEDAVIRAVMFSSFAKSLRFEPKDGMKLVVQGNVSLYENTGQYQIYISDMHPEGAGSLSIAFTKLKNKLRREGLFSQENKKEIPKFPRKIGVITSPSGAALHDILQVLKRRYPVAEVIFQPVHVQGEKSSEEIIKALKIFQGKENKIDVVILGRGGGSAEELWSFNEESLAREIFNFKIPIISAVGHETDYTICDFVADLRAPTPSAAAELAVPDKNELIFKIRFIFSRAEKSLLKNISTCENDLKFLDCKIRRNILLNLAKNKEILNILQEKINRIFLDIFNEKKNKILNLEEKLRLLNPEKIFKMGYALIENKEVKNIDSVKIGQILNMRLHDGKFECLIISKEKF